MPPSALQPSRAAFDWPIDVLVKMEAGDRKGEARREASHVHVVFQPILISLRKFKLLKFQKSHNLVFAMRSLSLAPRTPVVKLKMKCS